MQQKPTRRALGLQVHTTLHIKAKIWHEFPRKKDEGRNSSKKKKKDEGRRQENIMCEAVWIEMME